MKKVIKVVCSLIVLCLFFIVIKRHEKILKDTKGKTLKGFILQGFTAYYIKIQEVYRRTHNPKVVSSNLAPATKSCESNRCTPEKPRFYRGFLHV